MHDQILELLYETVGRHLYPAQNPSEAERMAIIATGGYGRGLLAAGLVTHRVYLEAAGAAVALLSLVWAVVSWRRHVARIRPPQAKATVKRSPI